MLRTIVTVVSFATFIGIVFWAYGKKRKGRFDEAANLPFCDDEDDERAGRAAHQEGKQP